MAALSDPIFYLLVAMGLLGTGFGALALRKGEYTLARVRRRDHPREFWKRVLYQMGIGGLLLVLAIRQLFAGAPTSVPVDSCVGYTSGWDCFMGEHFQSAALAAFGVAVPIAYAVWRWYQHRTLMKISATADAAEDDANRRDSAV
jgi:hypothetical protein